MDFRRLLVVGLLVGCEQKHQIQTDGAPAPDACNDLSCFVVDCQTKGLPPTTITGQVFAPNGTLPLFGVNVYVPASDPGPLPAGVQCDHCGSLQGGAIASTQTDEAGNFRLENVPATADVPIVIQTGKWRRQFKVSAVSACQDNAAAKVDTTLPKNRTEGDLPKIAITTGNADALECLVRKLGIDDAEFGISGDDRSVHLYQGNGVNKYTPTFAGAAGASFAPAKPFWDSSSALATYDIVMLSCEGDQLIDAAGGATVGINDKPQTSLQAMHDYAGVGGRVFMSHWHNVWIGGDKRATPLVGLPDWKSIITWAFGANQTDALTQITTVDETNVTPPAVIGGLPNPKGASFATWLMNVGASTTRDDVGVNSPRYTAASIANPPVAERWVYVDPARSVVNGTNGQPQSSVQDALFTTPIDLPEDQRCGKVVFSDMHVASGSSSPPNGTFPSSCATTDLTAQEKALAFIFFDISSCVGVLQ